MKTLLLWSTFSCWAQQVSSTRDAIVRAWQQALTFARGDGLTGFTGRLITRYLYDHPQRALFNFALGVRNKSKGEELNADLIVRSSVRMRLTLLTKADSDTSGWPDPEHEPCERARRVYRLR